MSLGKQQINALQAISWAMEHFGSLTTNRQVRRSTVLSLCTKGLVKSSGNVVVCDADGFTIQPERTREGFVLTKAGKDILARLNKEKPG